MDPDSWLPLFLAVAALLLFFMAHLSALETAVLNTRRSRLPQFAQGRRLARAERALEQDETFRTSAHLAKSLSESLLYAIAALVGMGVRVRYLGGLPSTVPGLLLASWTGILAGAVSAYLLVTTVAEALPKAHAARNPERVLVRWSRFILLFTMLFLPVRWVTCRVARVLYLGAESDPVFASRAAHSEEEIKLLVEGSAEEGVLEEEEKEMIQSIFEFTDTVARQVMVPRIDIHSVPDTATLDEVVREAMESGHSRLPVHQETVDTVVGVVHVKDLLPRLVQGDGAAGVREVMREPYFIPEGKKIDELLHEFRRQKSQMAIVVDEFGGTSGLVTVEDVLEEIVGEIEDEYDVPDPLPDETEAEGEGTVVDARMTIDDVNELLGLELPHGDWETLGGFVFSLFGRPAEVGERVPYDGVEFIAEAVDGLRLQRIRILAHQPEPEPDAQPA